jgi:uncharacterized protein with ATP-grasp and redox domains
MTDISTSEELTARQHRALAALLAEPTIRRAAEVSEVGDKTLYRWMREPAFAAAYREMRGAATQHAIALVQKYSSNAAATLCQLMASPNPAAIRLAAASKILDLAIKATEIEDIRRELEELKALEHDRIA